MADELPDPREVDWHPRRRRTVFGHHLAEERLLAAATSGKLHHAWLFHGARGIGKATLAYRFARFLLAGGRVDTGTVAAMDVAPDSSAFRQIAAGAHPDLMVLQPTWDGKKLKGEIAVADARKIGAFFSHTAGAGGYRVTVVDAADDLNAESANALLKLIEEPPPQSIFLLVSHRPGALLATIRSRTLDFALSPLSDADTLAVLAEVRPGQDLAEAAALSGGSPGRALELADSKGAAVFASFKAKPQLSAARAVEIAQNFGGRDKARDFQVFSDLLVGWVAAAARESALQGRGAALARAHDDIVYSLRQTDALNLDRRQAAVEALLLIDSALKAS